ncbi:MAG: PaaI family thioesterase [Syntrophales bacterium]|nr:PaaI family thioesterase [Syntrophales bacterium]MDD5640008.1 PaaI family thioesterase [Syntrophales bacterium]
MRDAKYRGTMLHYCQKMMTGEAASPPVAQLIGMELAAVRPGRVVIELEAGTRHASPLGTVHGGILCAIADAAMGLAYATTLNEGETFATVELKVNFLRPVWQGRLRAEGKVVNSGRNLGLVECDVTDHDQRLIARCLSTCMTLRGEEAKIDNGKSLCANPVKRRLR